MIGNIKFLFTNRQYINKEEKIKRQLETGAIEAHSRMVSGRHKLKGIRNEYSETTQPSFKTAG